MLPLQPAAILRPIVGVINNLSTVGRNALPHRNGSSHKTLVEVFAALEHVPIARLRFLGAFDWGGSKEPKDEDRFDTESVAAVRVAVGETVILLHPTPPLVGV